MSQTRTKAASPVQADGPVADRVTMLLRAWARGDDRAGDDLLPLLYQQLRRQAAAHLRRERQGHTLQPTALVHEAYLRLVGQRRVAWKNRVHFLALASRMMRRVLVDRARARRASKRPDPALRVDADERVGQIEPRSCDLLLLDRALEELTSLDRRQGRIVELCYFGGLSESEAAAFLGVSRSTVSREWRSAKAWLYRRMTTGRREPRT